MREEQLAQWTWHLLAHPHLSHLAQAGWPLPSSQGTRPTWCPHLDYLYSIHTLYWQGGDTDNHYLSAPPPQRKPYSKAINHILVRGWKARHQPHKVTGTTEGSLREPSHLTLLVFQVTKAPHLSLHGEINRAWSSTHGPLPLPHPPSWQTVSSAATGTLSPSGVAKDLHGAAANRAYEEHARLHACIPTGGKATHMLPQRDRGRKSARRGLSTPYNEHPCSACWSPLPPATLPHSFLIRGWFIFPWAPWLSVLSPLLRPYFSIHHI